MQSTTEQMLEFTQLANSDERNIPIHWYKIHYRDSDPYCDSRIYVLFDANKVGIK